MVAAQTRGEEAVQEVVASALRELGARVETVRYTPSGTPLRDEFAAPSAIAAGERVAVVGRWGGDVGDGGGGDGGAGGGGAAAAARGRSLILFAHPDGEDPAAAPAGAGPDRWTRPPFELTLDEAGRRAYGWAIADDILGVAAGVSAMRALRARGRRPRGALAMCSTPSKRHARGCAELARRGHAADAALYLHPAESGAGLREVKAYTSGQLLLTVTVVGAPPVAPPPPAGAHAHWAASATPEGDGHCAFAFTAVNPLDKALVVRDALVALGEARAARVRHATMDACAGRAAHVLVSSLRCGFGGFGRFGGAGLSSVQPAAELGAAVTFPPGEALADVRAEVEAAIARASAADAWLAAHPPEIAWVSGVSGAEVDVDGELFRAVSGAIARATGEAPHVNPMHTSSDIRVPAVQHGTPCVGFGARAGNLAQNGLPDEWIDLDDFARMVAAVEGVIEEWCGTEDAE